jgi:hypothetical protein
MHAIERPQLSRVGVLALSAVLLAIVVLLLAAARVGEIGTTSGSVSAAASGSGAAPLSAAANHARPAVGSWPANPFASPFRVVTPWPTATDR